MYPSLIGLPRSVKGAIFLIADLSAVVIAFYVALVLRLNTAWPIDWFISSIPLLVLLLILAISSNFFMRLHAIQLGSFDVNAISKTVIWSLGIAFTGAVANLFFDLGAPRTAALIFGPVLLILSLFSRLMAIYILQWMDRVGSKQIKVAVYGAGSGGLQLIAALRNSRKYRPTFFIDDSKRLRGVVIAGLRVHPPSDLKRLLKRGNVEKVFLAIPSISPTKKQKIIDDLQSLGCEVMELPSYVEMIESGGVINSLRPISPEQLLGRNHVDLNMPEIAETYENKNILVSGAGGSIGSELCRKILTIGPSCLVLYETSELALYTIEKELLPLAKANGVRLKTVLGAVENANRLTSALRENEVSIILHAAAYKHVPMVENNELEGARNNVLGTKAIADKAIECGIERFILISTDKAVRPTNIMGATKRMAELLIQDLQTRSQKTNFSIVRFGNVLGSSGSVIPLFKEQIENGGPITVTDKEVTRYFMTIPEAARLVLLCGAYGEGGDVFLLDMGEPVKIIELARQMIELSGLTVKDSANPNGDIEIKDIGLRPGEKLYEELLIGSNTLSTPHPKILRAREDKLTPKKIETMVSQLAKAVATDDPKLVRSTVKKFVKEYQPETH